MRNIIKHTINLFILLLFSNTAQAEEFPSSFFGIEVGAIYSNNEDFGVEITAEYLGPLGYLTTEDHFIPKKKRPMFPIFRKNDEEAFNFVISLYDIASGKKPPKIITAAVGWKIRKPFNKSYSYISRMNKICEMFNTDLKEVADTGLEVNTSYNAVKKILDKGEKAVCYFVPIAPITEKHKQFDTYSLEKKLDISDSYLSHINKNSRIHVQYDIKPLLDNSDGKPYETLYVQLSMNNDDFIKYMDVITKALKETKEEQIKKEANSNRPY